MRFGGWLLLALLPSCGPDPEPVVCEGADFEVLISAPDRPLPNDTTIRLHYGGRAFDDPEELVLAEPGTPQALFCYPATRYGVVEPGASAFGSSSTATAGAAGAGGSDDGGAPLDALLCKLWTDGSADLEVETHAYGIVKAKLESQKRVCTVKSVLELQPSDAGS
jgi:hypothetical protein